MRQSVQKRLENFGERLQVLRQVRHEFTTELKISLRDQDRWRGWEFTHRRPTFKSICEIADILDLTPNELHYLIRGTYEHYASPR